MPRKVKEERVWMVEEKKKKIINFTGRVDFRSGFLLSIRSRHIEISLIMQRIIRNV